MLLGETEAAVVLLSAEVALTAIAFSIGILIIPFAIETTGQALPE